MVECGRCETDVGEFLIYYRRGLLCTLFVSHRLRKYCGVLPRTPVLDYYFSQLSSEDIRLLNSITDRK